MIENQSDPPRGCQTRTTVSPTQPHLPVVEMGVGRGDTRLDSTGAAEIKSKENSVSSPRISRENARSTERNAK